MQHAKVCLAPIRFGAGLKGKLVDAMQNGTPCVTSSMGAEGMFGNLNANGFIENTPKDFTNNSTIQCNYVEWIKPFYWQAKLFITVCLSWFIVY